MQNNMSPRRLMCKTIAFFAALSLLTGLASAEESTVKVENSLKKSEQLKKIIDPYSVYTYDMLVKDSTLFAQMYPDLIQTESIGKSVEGRDIVLLRMGTGARKIFLSGGTHAREYISSTYLMNMVDAYAYAAQGNENIDGFDVSDMLKKVTFYIVPMVNPDGINLVQSNASNIMDVNKLKSIRVIGKKGYRSWKANINGVDLNRNFPVGWVERKTNTQVPSSEMFKGFVPASEPEIQAIMNLSNRNMFYVSISFHSQGELVYWGDKTSEAWKADAEPLADRLSAISGYKKIPLLSPINEYGAGFAEWSRYWFKRPTYTVELCPYYGPVPFPEEKFDVVWNKMRSAGLIAADEALKLDGYNYEVYQKESFLQAYKLRADAEAFAAQWQFSKVVERKNEQNGQQE